MSCCASKGDIWKIYIQYPDMKLKLIADYGSFKIGDNINKLGESQKKFLLMHKYAELEIDEKNQSNKKAKSTSNSEEADSTK